MLLNPRTRTNIEQFIVKPSHGLLITGATGAGKTTVARYIAAELLHVRDDKLDTYPYFRMVSGDPGKSVSIAEVREVTRFLAVKTPGTAGIARVVVFEKSERLTVQAQNALLKTLEEPPADTMIILTAAAERMLLPTVASRVQRLAVLAPSSGDIQAYFTDKGYTTESVQKALLVSGALPGLMTALLEADTDHPLARATAAARELLQAKSFDRLILAESLAKQRALWIDTLYILGQMAGAALKSNRGSIPAIRKWQSIRLAVYDAQNQTEANGQLKLVVLNFMLNV